MGAGALQRGPSEEGQSARTLKSFLNIGDSTREASIGVAPGFPDASLAEKELMIPESFAKFFGLIDASGKELVA